VVSTTTTGSERQLELHRRRDRVKNGPYLSVDATDVAGNHGYLGNVRAKSLGRRRLDTSPERSNGDQYP